MSSVAPGGHVAKWLTDGINAAARAVVAAQNKQERFEKSMADAIVGLAEADRELAEALLAKAELMAAVAVYAPDWTEPLPPCPDTAAAIPESASDTSGGA